MHKVLSRSLITLKLAALTTVFNALISPAQAQWWEQELLWGEAPLPGPFLDESKVNAWGETLETSEEISKVENAVNNAQIENAKYVGSISAFNPGQSAFDAYPELYDTIVIDIDGNWCPIPWKTNAFFCNTNDPVFQDYLKQQVRWLIDAGVDAVLIDEIEGTAGTLNRGGSFGQPDMDLFNDYLLTIYTAQELEDFFGIDIDTFNYGEYIRNRGSAAQYRSDPFQIPLFEHYRDFERKAVRSFMSELIEYGKNYAQTQYSREVAFTANIYAYHPHQMIFADLLDYYTVEYAYREDLYAPDGHATPFLLFGNAQNKRSVLLPGVYTGNEIRNWDTTDIGGLWLFETYVTGNTFFHANELYGGTSTTDGSEVEFALNADANSQYLKYITDYSKEFMGDRWAEIGVLYPYASDYINYIREDWGGTAYALLDAHIQYDVISLGDGAFLEDNFASVDLSPYKTLVLPAALNMKQSHLDKLLDYVSAGGTLIVVGDSNGVKDETNGTITRDEWNNATALGSRSYGSGEIHVLRDGWGLDYHSSRSPGQRAELTSLIPSSEAITETTAPSTLHLHSYVNADDSLYVIHMLNYDFDQSNYQIAPTAGFEVKTKLPSELVGQPNLTATQITPDGLVLPLSMALSNSGGATYATMDAYSVDIHSMIVIAPRSEMSEEADAALAKLDDYLDNHDTSGVSSPNINSVQAQISNAYANNNYYYAKHLALNLIEELKTALRPKVLFSESNGESSFVDYGSAYARNPDNPDSVHLGDLVAILGNEFDITSTKEYLTPSVLQGYDVLVINSPWDFFGDNEVETIHQFVANGGRLLLLGNPFLNGALNPIADPYGVFFHGEVVSTDEASVFGNFNLTTTGHPSLTSSELTTNWPTRLTVNSPATTVATTGPNGWLDEVNVDQIKGPGERSGNYAIAAAYDDGDSRVYFLSDNPFENTFLTATRNDLAFRTILEWLTGAPTGSSGTGSDPADSGYWGFIDFYYPGANGQGDAAPGADPDRDNLTNLAEFLMGTSPLVAQKRMNQHFDAQFNGNQITFVMDLEQTGEREWIKFYRSTNLNDWVEVQPVAESISGNQMTCTFNLTAANNNFYRMTATFE